jgi:site-specific DNA recombinase
MLQLVIINYSRYLKSYIKYVKIYSIKVVIMDKKAIGYVRVSTDEQAKEGLSLDAQADRVKAFARAKGWELAEIIEDPGQSGKDLSRPGVRRLVDICRDRGADVVIVYKVDRLTRKQRDLWSLLDDVFIPNDVGFVSVTEPFDTTAAMGKAFLGMLGVFAQLERDMIVERTRAALSFKKGLGEWIGRRPTGFKINGKKLEADPEAMRKIERAKQLRRQGKSYRAISGLLAMPKSTVCDLVNVNLKSLKSKYL